jgi:hypothetical protein
MGSGQLRSATKLPSCISPVPSLAYPELRAPFLRFFLIARAGDQNRWVQFQ